MEIIGILNVTPDSFSDGGKHLKNPIKDALKMIKDGATIIDIGGQTTKPGAEIITTNTELSRVIPVLRKLKEVIGSKKMDVKISIDTMNSTVALESIKLGVDFINDVSMGKYDKNMLGVVSQNNVKYIISHSINPMDHLHDVINKNTILNNVVSELNERVEQLIKNKICKNKIIIDPGIGFSKPT
jgi:dihydropteroate synthase